MVESELQSSLLVRRPASIRNIFTWYLRNMGVIKSGIVGTTAESVRCSRSTYYSVAESASYRSRLSCMHGCIIEDTAAFENAPFSADFFPLLAPVFGGGLCLLLVVQRRPLRLASRAKWRWTFFQRCPIFSFQVRQADR